MVESEVKRLLMVLNCLSIFKIIERGGKKGLPSHPPPKTVFNEVGGSFGKAEK